MRRRAALFLLGALLALGGAAAAAPHATPRCFGAAARDRAHPCRNPQLDRAVTPSPYAAQLYTDAPCRRAAGAAAGAVFAPCAFGVTDGTQTATVALAGDSHAATWRAALAVVARARGWRGLSITRPGCPFSTQIPRSPDLGPGDCIEQHRRTLAWLAAHPEVRTLFVADWAQPPSGPHGGTAGYGGGVEAFGAMLDQVPPSVTRIHVLRDNPGTVEGTATCVASRHRRHRSLLRACSSPRAVVLTPDPGVQAAATRRPRVHVIDLTRVFCGPDRCYPVIGGAYVYKDDNHMNAVFSATLGPLVLRSVQAAEG